MSAPFFNILEYITYSKKPYNKLTESERKEINPFMINRYLSMNLEYVDIVNYVQSIPYERKESYYKIYSSILPKSKLWLKYIKKGKGEKDKDEILGYVSRYYECSKREANDYLKILDKKELKEILSGMALNEKEIKKLLK